jgi:hypothetical protein
MAEPRSRTFKKQVLDEYVLTPAEMVLLDSATMLLAEIEMMQLALADSDIVVTGSTGQPVTHPLVGELRQHRLAFASIVRRMQLPDVSVVDDEKAMARSMKARKAARARWGMGGHGAQAG